MTENIPAELRAIPHWVAAGPDKKPINPITGRYADPSDPSTGGTFAEALQCGMQHVGFILSKDDPFTVIDLDNPFERKIKGVVSTITPTCHDYAEAVVRANRHTAILTQFPTYAEVSQSGTGAHLVMRGKVPQGIRRDKVEIYSADRYIIFTGNIIKHAPIADCQTLLDSIVSQMGKMLDKSGKLIEEEPSLEDEAVWKMASTAANADKFQKLCQGEWEGFGYPTHSEAALGLVSMLAFYSRSNEQVRRMFRQTILASQRDKYFKNDVHIDRILGRIRSNEIPLVDISHILQAAPLAPAIPEPPQPPSEFPPGLVGEIASYIYSSAGRPVKEMALAAALSLVAGIAGRSFNFYDSGLNQYILVVAGTGKGKEEMAKGINRIFSKARKRDSRVDEFMGPAAFASGQAMIRTLDQQPCFLSVMGEIGIILRSMLFAKPGSPMEMLQKVVLDVYSKSSINQILHSSAYSEKDKNTKSIVGPNVTILGDTTENIYEDLDASNILSGLLPRFTILEYSGPRVKRNRFASRPPDDKMVQKVLDLVEISLNTRNNGVSCPVNMLPEAETILDNFDDWCDDLMNSKSAQPITQIWVRGHLKALKIAGLVAVGCDPHQPVVTPEIANWSIEFVKKEITSLWKKFSDGDIGLGEGKQESEIRRLLGHFNSLSEVQKKRHRCPDELMDKEIAPLPYLATYSRNLACFSKDRRGATVALRNVLEDLVRREVLNQFPQDQLIRDFNMRSPIYYRGPAW